MRMHVTKHIDWVYPLINHSPRSGTSVMYSCNEKPLSPRLRKGEMQKSDFRGTREWIPPCPEILQYFIANSTCYSTAKARRYVLWHFFFCHDSRWDVNRVTNPSPQPPSFGKGRGNLYKWNRACWFFLCIKASAVNNREITPPPLPQIEKTHLTLLPYGRLSAFFKGVGRESGFQPALEWHVVGMEWRVDVSSFDRLRMSVILVILGGRNDRG